MFIWSELFAELIYTLSEGLFSLPAGGNGAFGRFFSFFLFFRGGGGVGGGDLSHLSGFPDAALMSGRAGLWSVCVSGTEEVV